MPEQKHQELQKTGLYQLTIVIDSQGKLIAYQNVLLHFKMCLFALQTFLKIMKVENKRIFL